MVVPQDAYQKPVVRKDAVSNAALSDERLGGDGYSTRRTEVPVVELIRGLRDDTQALFRSEIELAKTEVGEKAARIAKSTVTMAIGGMLTFVGLLVLLGAVSALAAAGLVRAGVDEVTAAWLGPLIVGGVVVALGAIFIVVALRRLTKESFVPEETVQTLKENKQWAERRMKH